MVFPLLLFKKNVFIVKANPVPISASAWAVSERTRRGNFHQSLPCCSLEGRTGCHTAGTQRTPASGFEFPLHPEKVGCGGKARAGSRRAFHTRALSPSYSRPSPRRAGTVSGQPTPRPASLSCFPSLLSSPGISGNDRPWCTPSGFGSGENTHSHTR